jgi:hypothetical protein
MSQAKTLLGRRFMRYEAYEGGGYGFAHQKGNLRIILQPEPSQWWWHVSYGEFTFDGQAPTIREAAMEAVAAYKEQKEAVASMDCTCDVERGHEQWPWCLRQNPEPCSSCGAPACYHPHDPIGDGFHVCDRWEESPAFRAAVERKRERRRLYKTIRQQVWLLDNKEVFLIHRQSKEVTIVKA